MPLGVHAVAAAFIALAIGYALAIPPWNNPDEPAHYNYIAALATKGELPVLEPGDWDADRLERLKAAKFADPHDIVGIEYEAHQPPLYYALATPLYLATESLPVRERVLALRGLSILLGVALVYVTAALALVLRPGDRLVAVLASAFVAFLPMHTSMAAAINNDALANLLGALLLLLGVAVLRTGTAAGTPALLGVVVGLAVITKTTVYALVPVALAAAWLRWRRRGAAVGWWSVFGLALLCAGWWIVRNAVTYGPTDLLATQRHDEVVVGQLRTADLAAEAWPGLLLTLRNSFIGVFGWMGIPLPQEMYLAYGGPAALVLLGGVAALVRTDGRAARPWIATLVAAVSAVTIALVIYNLEFVQPQGRYLFASLAAIGMLVAAAIGKLSRVPGNGLAPMVALTAVLLAAGVLAVESAAVLWPGLPRRALYPGLMVAVVLGATALARWGERFRAGVAAGTVAIALGWADLAMLLGVAAPAFR